jgi:hypothetical protein
MSQKIDLSACFQYCSVHNTFIFVSVLIIFYQYQLDTANEKEKYYALTRCLRMGLALVMPVAKLVRSAFLSPLALFSSLVYTQ